MISLKLTVLSLAEKDFMNATWLFAEAYKYRRLRECFSVSKHWQDYDVFFRQKVCSNALVDYFLRGRSQPIRPKYVYVYLSFRSMLASINRSSKVL